MALPSRLAVRSILGSSSWVSWTAVNATFATLAETGMRKGDVLRPKQGGTFEKGRLTFASALAGCGLRRQRRRSSTRSQTAMAADSSLGASRMIRSGSSSGRSRHGYHSRQRRAGAPHASWRRSSWRRWQAACSYTSARPPRCTGQRSASSGTTGWPTACFSFCWWCAECRWRSAMATPYTPSASTLRARSTRRAPHRSASWRSSGGRARRRS